MTAPMITHRRRRERHADRHLLLDEHPDDLERVRLAHTTQPAIVVGYSYGGHIATQWVLRYPQFAQWCGTELTADWHTRFNTAAMVYGHLHIPRTTWYDGVRHEEVSVGYPREWRRLGGPPGPRQILPYPVAP